jgi:hypothetical protein
MTMAKSKAVLASESKSFFAAGAFKDASLLLAEIRESDPHNQYVQLGDGTIHVVELDEKGDAKRDKHGERVTKAIE